MDALQDSRQGRSLAAQRPADSQVAAVDVKTVAAIHQAQRALAGQAGYQIQHDFAAGVRRHDQQQIARERVEQRIHAPNLTQIGGQRNPPQRGEAGKKWVTPAGDPGLQSTQALKSQSAKARRNSALLCSPNLRRAFATWVLAVSVETTKWEAIWRLV